MNNKNETKEGGTISIKKIALEKNPESFVNNLLTLVVLKTNITLQNSWNCEICFRDTCSYEYFLSYMYIQRLKKF